MSIVQVSNKEVDGSKQVEAVLLRLNRNEKGEVMDEISSYVETPEEKDVTAMILRHLVLGNVNMYTPRVEFNDL